MHALGTCIDKSQGTIDTGSWHYVRDAKTLNAARLKGQVAGQRVARGLQWHRALP